MHSGKTVVARGQRPGEPGTKREAAWPAYEKLTVRRNTEAT